MTLSGKTKAAWRASSFYIEGGPAFQGFTQGEHWNGWACPVFPKEEAEKVMAETYQGGEAWWSYDAEQEAFKGVLEGNAPEDVDVWLPQEIEVDGQMVKVWPIGASCWCWDDVAEVEG